MAEHPYQSFTRQMAEIDAMIVRTFPHEEHRGPHRNSRFEVWRTRSSVTFVVEYDKDGIEVYLPAPEMRTGEIIEKIKKL